VEQDLTSVEKAYALEQMGVKQTDMEKFRSRYAIGSYLCRWFMCLHAQHRALLSPQNAQSTSTITRNPFAVLSRHANLLNLGSRVELR
jgi:uncharacterized protein YodC (DUF2158 family)